MRTYRIGALALLLPLALLAGCSDDNPTGPGRGQLRVQMTDAPAEIQAVNLVVTEVSARTETSDTTSGWQILNATAQTYNLLSLQNGVFATIGDASVPAGTYTQVRLKLGAGSTIVVDGVTYPLTVPSGMQSGLKLNGSFNVPAGGTTDIALDFDASRSIIQNGAGDYILKPVVKIMGVSSAGAIKGVVQPAGVTTSIVAVVADTLGTTVAAADGKFTLSVLPAGTYTLRFDPASTAYRDTVLTGIVVSAGSTTDVDTVALTLQ